MAYEDWLHQDALCRLQGADLGKNVKEKADHSILALIVHDPALDDRIAITKRPFPCKPFDKECVRNRTIPVGQ